MKVLILLLFPVFVTGQLYIGNSMGISINTYKYLEEGEVKAEKYKEGFLFYSMPIGYQVNNYLIESGWSYNGNVLINLMGGIKIGHGKTTIDLLLGGADMMDMPAKDHITQSFIPVGEVRFNHRLLYLHSTFYKGGYMVGIGIKAFTH